MTLKALISLPFGAENAMKNETTRKLRQQQNGSDQYQFAKGTWNGY